MEKTEQNFKLEKETKNTWRYEAEQEGRPISVTTIYIQKWALGSKPPDKIKITVEEA